MRYRNFKEILIGCILVISILPAFSQGEVQEKEVKLTYLPNGGFGEPIIISAEVGEIITLLSSVEGFEKEGTFLSGWTSAADGSGVNYNLGEPVKVLHNMNFFAKWTNLSFGNKVTYVYQNNRGEKFLDPNNYPSGTEVKVLENTTIYPLHAFVGYNTKPDGTGMGYQPGDQFVITADITLYGQWVKGLSGPVKVLAKTVKKFPKVEITWEEVANADSYKVYCQKSSDREFELKEEVENKLSVIQGDLESNSLYRFAVSAIIKGKESVKTVSNKVVTHSLVLVNDEVPIVEYYENNGSTVIMSDAPLNISVDKIEGLNYFYSLNGTVPTTRNQKVEGKNLLLEPPKKEQLNKIELRIIAYKDELGYSPVYQHSFEYKMPKPESDVRVGGYPKGEVPDKCKLYSKVPGTIHYTLNGTNPTVQSKAYEEPILISSVGTTTIKAIVVRDGFEQSDIAIFDFGQIFGGYEWANPYRFAVEREDPRATFFPYGNEKDALAYHNICPENSPYYKSLDGKDWRFKWVRKPYDRNAQNGLLPNGKTSFEVSKFDDSEWDTIPVPSCWTVLRDKTGRFKYDGPAYCPAGYIWNAAFLGNTGLGAPISPYYPPQMNQSTNPASGEINSETGTNPVGSYRKIFTLDSDWDDREIFINFSGVSSACYVWVNGHPVGYAEDRFTDKEFNITPFVKKGENLLAVQVFRWCSGSWIEDQDMNRHAGIFRSVYLLSRPKIEIGDFEVHTYPVNENRYDGDWNLEVDVLLREFGVDNDKLKKANLSLTLFDSKGEVVTRAGGRSVSPVFETKTNSLGNSYSGADLGYTLKVRMPKLWSAEHPNLYKLLLTLKDNNDLLETTAIRVGFREIKVVGNGTNNPRVLINGSRILLHGTNTHEIDVNNGYTVSKELIEKDLKLMKQNNINAIRLSHYPHHIYYYELADEYGIYLMDEANLECHGSREVSVTNDLQPIMQDRQRNMFERDKNHSSVVFWSTGNENYEGHDEELLEIFRKNNTQWLRDRDLSKRPVHQSFDNGGADFFGTGYQYPSDLDKTIVDLKTPMLQTEYCHNMGNAIGVMKEYIDFFEREPKSMGGFTWDWVDQEITTPIIRDGKITGETYLGFGEDWDDTELGGWWEDPSGMSSMGCNGLILTDRTVKPQMAEVRRQYQMIKVGLIDKNTFYVNNKYLFTNVDEFDMEWKLLEDGRVIQQNKQPLKLDVEPAPSGVAQTTMTTKEFPVPFKLPEELKPGAEYFFNVKFKTKQDEVWASKGFAVSKNQMPVDFGQGELSVIQEPEGQLTVNRDNDLYIRVTGKSFAVDIDKNNGLIQSFRAKNASGELTELLASGPIPNFFRSPVDGEREAINANRNSQARNFLLWKNSSKDRKTTSVEVSEESHKVVINIKGDIPVLIPRKEIPQDEGVRYKTSYTIYPSGEIVVGFDFRFPAFQNKKFPYVAEIGSILKVKGDYENLTWYGRGPGDTYVNRKCGNDVGIWKSTVTDRSFMYPSTQEMGNNVETRWFALTDQKGFGLIIKGEPMIDFNATHYAPQDLSKAFDPEFSPHASKYHPYQIEKDEDTYLRVVHKGTGVGGINSWGKKPLEQYRIVASEKSFSFKYTIKPMVTVNIDKAMEFWKTRY